MHSRRVARPQAGAQWPRPAAAIHILHNALVKEARHD